MKRTSIIFAAVCMLLGLLSPDAGAQVPPLPSPDTNVAFGAEVQLKGYFGCAGKRLAPQKLVDDIFLPSGQAWDQAPVCWNESDGQPRFIFIGLGGLQRITGFTVQADNNDSYELSHWDEARSEWIVAWSVPQVSGFGMQTRPDAYDNNQRYVLASPIWTTDLRVRATNGDGRYSLSEIRAFGSPA